MVLQEFGNDVEQGGSGVIIASQSVQKLPALTAEQDMELETTPQEKLLSLPFLQSEASELAQNHRHKKRATFSCYSF